MSDSSLLHALAGAGAGCASLAITYPLYARMMRQQVHKHKQGESECSESEHGASSSSLLASARSLLTREGLAPHFAGLPAALYAVGVQSACYYFFFQAAKNFHGVSTSPLGNILVGTEAGVATVLLTNPLWVINSRQITRAKQKPAQTATAAQEQKVASPEVQSTDALSAASPSLPTSIARAASSNSLGLPAAPPPEHAAAATEAPVVQGSPKSLQLSDNHQARTSSSLAGDKGLSPSSSADGANEVSLSDVSFLTALRLLVAREGLAGVYSGVGPALALVSSPALQFASYEYMRAILLRVRGAARRARMLASSAGSPAAPLPALALSSADLFLLGALSKIVATLLTYPIQTVKARIQQDGSAYSGVGVGLWSGVVACVRDMARSPEGITSFYHGLRAKILQTGLTAAFLFVIRERLLLLLQLAVRWSQRRPAIRA